MTSISDPGEAGCCSLSRSFSRSHSGTRNHIQPDLSLLLFLKFISSIIPTIEYDFTVNFDTGGAK